MYVVRLVEERFHRDDEGRPLREGRTPPEFLRDGDIEYKTCPYAGSRHDHANPMNVSALRQTSAHWDEIVDSLAFLRLVYGPVRDIMDLWRVSQLGSALPWFFIFRDGATPAYAAALSKATLGVGILAQRLLARVLAEPWQPPALTPESILELAEASGTLVGHTEVCSGPDKMLLRFFAAYLDTPPSRALADREAIVSFGACYANFKLALWIYHLARRFLYADAGLADLLAAPIEPPDFFVLEPDLVATPPAKRAAWLAGLARLIVPFAPSGADVAVRDGVLAIAAEMAQGGTPKEIYGRLDARFADLVAAVETGFRRALGDTRAVAIDEATRDRLLIVPPRAALS